MKCEVVPAELSDLVPFSSSTCSPYISKDVCTTFGDISKNGLWMWIVHGTAIDIYRADGCQWCGGHCFGESLKNPSAKITSVTEFCSSHISFPCLLIAVNQDHESLLCMFNANTSKIVRTVLIPDKISSIEVISGDGGACMETHHLNIQLRYMFGIVAVGTVNGHIYFLDLCLDENFSCDERLPNITFVLNKHELSPQRRETLISKKQHVFMLLNDKSTRNGCFEFQSRSHTLGRFPNDDVHVTALKYIHGSATLAVGFSFGGIQLWNLQDLSLQFTAANHTHEQPIVAFAFQEPENDPKNFCYLWVIRGHLRGVESRPKSMSIATLYSLTYYRREYLESFGFLYTELQSCNKRFEYPLTDDPFNTNLQSNSFIGTCLVSCQVVCQTDVSPVVESAFANESDCASESMSLCFLSWSVWSGSEIFPSSYHMALFDLNQWYQAHMPFHLRCDPTGLSPYFGIFSLEEVANNFYTDMILGVHVVPQSIKKFKFISPSEEFFYPSSLDFQIVCFSASGLSRAKYLGLQKSLLFELAEIGPEVLINPKEMYSSLVTSGLVSDLYGGVERVSLITQREMILQLFLEYHIPLFFMKCLKEWQYTDSIHEYCTSRGLLNWAWKKVISIKNAIDKLSLPLFNCSGSDIDLASLKSLCSFRRQLDLIDTIIIGYEKFSTPRTEKGIQDLHCRKDVIFSINMYLQVLLWLRSVHILPEVCEGEETAKNILYPVTTLVQSYSCRRKDLQKIHSCIGLTDVLLIDGLVQEAVISNTWQEKGGTGIYPPPSVYAALSCYLLEGTSMEMKHALLYYLLLDICNSASNWQNPLITEIKKFPVVFGMSHSLVKIIKAFWYLDQKNFEVALKKLLDPVLKSSDILPWQHQRVIKSFLYQREPQKALKYINHMEPPQNTIEEMKLHLSVLLSQGAVTQAFDYQRKKQNEGCGTELLNHLFLGCQEMRRLKELMYLPLNALESSSLITYLSQNEDPRAQEALVMYYLLHCNFFEAEKVNQKLSNCLLSKASSTYERMGDRDALIESFLSAVPKTEKNLVQQIKQLPSSNLQKERQLKVPSQPLSVKSRPMKEISYSDILNSLVSDFSSTVNAVYMGPQTPFKKRTDSYFDNMPFLRPPVALKSARQLFATPSNTPVAKRTLSSPNSNEFSSPMKKSRLLDNATFKTTPIIKKKIPKHLLGDVASLLQSPPIHRRNSKTFKEGTPRNCPVTAPTSILKKHVQNNFADMNSYNIRTPSVLSEMSDDEKLEEEAIEFTEEKSKKDIGSETPSRQIRFSVPATEQSSIDQDIDYVPTQVKSAFESLSSNTKLDVLMDKHDDFEDLPELEPSYETVSSSSLRKKTLSGLIREPLKAHSKHISSTYTEIPVQLGLLKNVESYDTHPETHEASRSKLTVESTKTSSLFTSCHSELDCPSDVKVDEIPVISASIQSQSSGASVKSNLLQLSSKHIPNSSHDQNESLSGSSNYSSASERSLIVTPRRPLRDNSCNTSSAIESQNRITLSSDLQNQGEENAAVSKASSSVQETISAEKIDNTSKEHYLKFSDKNTEKIQGSSAAHDEIESSSAAAEIHSSFVADDEIQSSSVAHDDIQSSSVAHDDIQSSLVAHDDIQSSSVAHDKMQTLSVDEIQNSSVAHDKIQTLSLDDEIQTASVAVDEMQSHLHGHILFTNPDNANLFSPVSEINLFTTISTPQSFMQRFDFMSENSQQYESTTLYQETLELLKESDEISQDHELKSTDEKVSSVTKSYFFTKHAQSLTITNDDQLKPDSKSLGSVSKNSEELHTDKVEFLQTSDTGTYEEFSKSLQKGAETDHSKTTNVKKTFESSPNVASDKISKKQCPIFTKKNTTEKFATKEEGSSNKQSSLKKNELSVSHETLSGKAQKSKKKVKSKGSKNTSKVEFSFAEPHSPAGPEILEALTSPPEHPVPSFMFSPPLTRGRLRQKKLDETLGSSFASVGSDASFSKGKKPPIDPILEEIMQGKAPESKGILDGSYSNKSRSISKKKTVTKKFRSGPKFGCSSGSPQLSFSADGSYDELLKQHDLSTSTRHSMILRQAKAKNKTEKHL